jgi:hypothetical protein
LDTSKPCFVHWITNENSEIIDGTEVATTQPKLNLMLGLLVWAKRTKKKRGQNKRIKNARIMYVDQNEVSAPKKQGKWKTKNRKIISTIQIEVQHER